MILSAYERKQSPFVYIQFTPSPGAKKRYQKTTIRKTDPQKEHKLAVALNKLEAQLLSDTHAKSAQTESGWYWVPGYLGLRYHGKSKEATLKVYMTHWQHLSLFLRETGISTPAMLEREHCFEYVEWRTSQVKEKSRKHPSQNSAIGELKLLGLLMDEAVLRGYAPANNARKLRLERDESAVKPELSDANIQTIYKALEAKPVWMQRSFHIALHTGLRFSETRIDRSQVDLLNRTIVIEKPKGGRKRAFAIPIYNGISKMIEEFMAGREKTLWNYESKTEETMKGLIWSKFMGGLDLPLGACFHSTRVTFISRGARAGIPQSAMMKMVNHSSAEIHRVYQRLAPADAHALQALIPIPSSQKDAP